MKVLVYIVSIYIFALSVLPCTDGENCNSNYIIENSAQEITQTECHTHNLFQEHCTPFCACNCCGQSYSNAISSISIFGFQNSIIKKYFYYKNSFVKEVFVCIWKPPKIS